MILTVGNGLSLPTLTAALEEAKKFAPDPVTIQLMPGRYYEKTVITQANLTIEGESAENTVIIYDDSALEIMPDGLKRGTFGTYTMLVDAPRVTLRRLTIENSAGPGRVAGQAIALYAEGEGILVDQCRLLGYQDTLFTGPLPPKEIEPGGFRGPKQFSPRINGRQYYRDTYICGTVDFIFGSATAYFEHCTIESLDSEIGFVTAGSSPEGQTYGYVFNECRFIGQGAPRTRYLGRPWRDYARVIIMRSEIGPHICPEAWNDWGKERAHSTCFFGEFENYGPGAEGNRPKWTHQLTSEEAAAYTRENVLGY